MTRFFADACYWIALLHRNDQLHAAALAAQQEFRDPHIVTTDEVLTEVLNFYSSRGRQLRDAAVQVIEALRKDDHVTVVEQSRASFDGGLALYKSRADKEWSLVDCISFNLMNRDGITEALTYDHHFIQAGFSARLQAAPDNT